MKNIEVSIVTHYSGQIAAGIGSLMPDLSPDLPSSPIPRDELKAIIDSPYHDQLIARHWGQVIGAATMSLILGTKPPIGRKAWLEDFVVSSDENIRGQGVGLELWHGIIEWCQGKDAKTLEFTSQTHREAAHKFYKRQGAVIRDTNVFSVRIPKLD